MARTIADIKKEMTDAFIADPEVQQSYNLDPALSFEDQFSVVSIESIIFYIVAFSINVLERIFATHRIEINTMLDERLPHRRQWYRYKVLRFQFPDRDLIEDSDQYDNTGLTDDDIEDLEVVKFCAVNETPSKLIIKVAKGEPGNRQPLGAQEETALEYYITEIKDAGVNIELVNQQADKFFINLDVYYNPLILDPADGPVEAAITEYVSTLSFNGELSKMAVEDAIQAVEGVQLVNIIKIETQRALNPKEDLNVRTLAESGYWIVDSPSDIIITYHPYAAL